MRIIHKVVIYVVIMIMLTACVVAFRPEYGDNMMRPVIATKPVPMLMKISVSQDDVDNFVIEPYPYPEESVPYPYPEESEIPTQEPTQTQEPTPTLAPTED